MLVRALPVAIGLTFFILFSYVFPSVAFADTPFVPCDGSPTNPCGTCQVVTMANTIIQWLIAMTFMLFAILFAVAGFKLVTSGGDTAAKSAAKASLVNALIGLLLILAAWLIVDTLMKAILDGNEDGTADGRIVGYGLWAEVECYNQVPSFPWPGDPSEDPDLTPSPGTPSGPPPAACSGSACVSLSERGVPCSNAASCSISPDMVDRLAAFHTAAGVAGARVTEGMPPTRVHKSACHQQGTCVDYGVAGGMQPADVIRTISAARANGLRPVYEVQTEAQKQAIVAAGGNPSDVKVLGNWISAPHFSIYGQ